MKSTLVMFILSASLSGQVTADPPAQEKKQDAAALARLRQLDKEFPQVALRRDE